MSYIENEKEFRLFMNSNGQQQIVLRNAILVGLDIVSNEGINIDSNVPDGDEIISWLRETENQRDKYTDASHYGDFKSAIKKYRKFINSSCVSLLEDIEFVKNDIRIMDKDALIKARIGQGIFRKKN